MGVRFGSLLTKTQQNALPANATETVIYVLGPVILAADSVAVFFNVDLTIVAGTGTTALVLAIRRGSTTAGNRISGSTWQQSVVAGNAYKLALVYFDVFSASMSSYCLTITQTGASGAGTLNDGAFAAFVL